MIDSIYAGMDFEVKNRKTGKIYWLSKKGVEQLKKLNIINKYIVSELKALKKIQSPQDFKLVKNETRRKEIT